jgi:hypothetical protein
MKYRTKGPTEDGWQLRVIDVGNAAQYFNGEQMNVGVILGPSSHGLTDTDLDCVEARAIGPYILPKTGAVFGRASSRNAHWLYYTDLSVGFGKAAIVFNDPKTKKRLLELRIGGGKGAQTVFPGSTHKETGESITWEESGEPTAVDDRDLLRSVHDLGAYSLVARYWPRERSNRHQCALIVGGFLARAGKSAPEIKIVAEAIAKAANDEEWRDRRKAAEDAAIAYQAGDRAYGLPAMREQFANIIADQVADWLGYNEAKTNGKAGPAEQQQDTGVTLDDFVAYMPGHSYRLYPNTRHVALPCRFHRRANQ